MTQNEFRNTRRDMRMIQTRKQKHGVMGSVDTLGKPRRIQKGISLELETWTNNKHSKEI